MLATCESLVRIARTEFSDLVTSNAPHYPAIGTFPAHFHTGDEGTVVESHLSTNPEVAVREILVFVRARLS